MTPANREKVYEFIRSEIKKGRQAFFIFPLIEESEKISGKSATAAHKKLSEEIFPNLKIGLLHGRMKPKDKEEIMNNFKEKDLDILVSTSVIEVGVDVPNASLMVIDHAERMGLAQLHQLRGRVGRGAAQSLCILLYHKPLSELARTRLKVIFENTDGFVIAQQDLQLRGPGELLGARQSGVAMLRFADIEADEDLLEYARDVADELLSDYPDAARTYLHRWMANKHDYLHV